MDRQLSEAILSVFRDTDIDRHRQCLQRFSVRRWRWNFHWLDASGLAIYFLKRIELLNLTEVLPDAVIEQLKQRHRDNERRNAALFEEFVRLNVAFKNADVRYLNLKGFTLVPEYCRDTSLRYQTDCDFLIDSRDAQTCGEILRALGYFPIGQTELVLEFKTDPGGVPRIRDLYKDKPQRAVELHICRKDSPSFHSDLLERAQEVGLDGRHYPCLSVEDMFLSQASHLSRHLRSEWTRISWLLELQYFITRHVDDDALWQAVHDRAAQQSDGPLTVGLAIRMAEKAFGGFAPDALKSWSYPALSGDVDFWIEHCGNQVLLTDFPGSKLYLMLEKALGPGLTSAQVFHRLLPCRLPGRFMPDSSSHFTAYAGASWARCTYFLFRLRFHLTAGAGYFIQCLRSRWLHKAGSRKAYAMQPRTLLNSALDRATERPQ